MCGFQHASQRWPFLPPAKLRIRAERSSCMMPWKHFNIVIKHRREPVELGTSKWQRQEKPCHDYPALVIGVDFWLVKTICWWHGLSLEMSTFTWVDIILDSLSRCWFVTWAEAICPGSCGLATSWGPGPDLCWSCCWVSDLWALLKLRDPSGCCRNIWKHNRNAVRLWSLPARARPFFVWPAYPGHSGSFLTHTDLPGKVHPLDVETPSAWEATRRVREPEMGSRWQGCWPGPQEGSGLVTQV